MPLLSQQSIGELIGDETLLKDFQQIRDGEREFDLGEIVMDEPQTPDLLF